MKKEVENIIIVHGEKPRRDGSMHPAFRERVKVAIEWSRQCQGQYIIVVTGGKTRKKAEPEAVSGAQLLGRTIHTPIFIEDRSRTTIENINFTRALLKNNGIVTRHYIVVDSRKRMFRLKYLYRKLWPEICQAIQFVPAPDTYPISFYMWEYISYLLDHVDIRERGILRLTKNTFRS